jgi:hypothetical protein
VGPKKTTSVQSSLVTVVSSQLDSFLKTITPVSNCLTLSLLHCKDNPIYVFHEKRPRGHSPNFHIHVSVSDLYIPRIGPHIFLEQNRQTDRGNI